jgi:hypothetical protein
MPVLPPGSLEFMMHFAALAIIIIAVLATVYCIAWCFSKGWHHAKASYINKMLHRVGDKEVNGKR